MKLKSKTLEHSHDITFVYKYQAGECGTIGDFFLMQVATLIENWTPTVNNFNENCVWSQMCGGIEPHRFYKAESADGGEMCFINVRYS